MAGTRSSCSRDTSASGSDAIQAKKDGIKLEYVTPASTILIENPIAVTKDAPSKAQKFVNFLSGAEGQQAIADSYAMEYPLNPEVSLGPPVKPFAELEPPRIDVATLNSEPVTRLLQEEGLL